MAHLDLVRTMGRALRRAGLPVAYSEGFNPQPRLSFAAPLPVGTAGLAELGEVETSRPVPHQELAARLNEVLPRGLQILEVAELPPGAPALMATVDNAHYTVVVETDRPWPRPPEECLATFLALEQIEITRPGKDGRKKVRNIRPGILQIHIAATQPHLTLALHLRTGSVMNIRPTEVVGAFLRHCGQDADGAIQITRTGLGSKLDLLTML